MTNTFRRTRFDGQPVCQPVITKQIAVTLTHGTILESVDYQNADGTPERWRVNGKVKTWKTRPNDFKIPVKRGLREYGYIDHNNAQHFYIAESL